jgi:diadenylate cyclase
VALVFARGAGKLLPSGCTVSPIQWQHAVDFLALAVAIYFVLRWGKEGKALRLAAGIILLRIASLVARQLDLVITSWLLDAALVVAILVVLVVFQSEIRHALGRLDILMRLLPEQVAAPQPALRAISLAAFSLARARLGAIIIILRSDSAQEFISGGVPLGGQVSREILEAIFRKASPVHDGAVIIQGDQISSVAALLPLTDRLDLPSEFGTRHRAAIGLSNVSDALAVVVSEERGEVGLVHGGRYQEMSNEEDLLRHIRKLEVAPAAEGATRSRFHFFQNLWMKATAAGLAALVWALSFSVAGDSVRSITLPVEFVEVPRGLGIAGESVRAVDVQLRGRWMFGAGGLDQASVRVNLRDARPGWHTLPVNPSELRLPPGIVVERVVPRVVSVLLVPEPGETKPPPDQNGGNEK